MHNTHDNKYIQKLVYIKTKIYLFIILYNGSITDIEHYQNYTVFANLLPTKWDTDNHK